MSKSFDWTKVGDVWFYAKTYRFYHEGLKKLRARLKEFEGIEQTFELEASPFKEELNHIERMIEWGEKRLVEKSDEVWINGVSVQSLRYLKAGGLLNVQEQEKKRDEFLSKPWVPTSLIQAISEKIDTLKAMTEMGALKGLRPADVLFELKERIPDTTVPPTSPRKKGALARLMSENQAEREIPVADEELRRRCLKTYRALFASTTPKASPEQLDMIVREMSAVLEDRVRRVANLPRSKIGVDLMTAALKGTPPRLLLSDDSSAQEGAHLIFRGFIGFVRNEVGHKLVSTYRPAEVLQLLGFVDYMLSLLTTAKKTFEKTENSSGE